ncbi:FAD-dependent oxidoreductase [Nesterenkonia natronophila]|uniref:Flavoprotein n=1 Tax=Nesterenkonia natronophila TaxID=2174932 RepID=A0A3A4FCF7_9MICC|nr:FAD-dependent oxidoreductase [Nesterenkonia natronophila]RJN32787.1 flavoprotein [Nesterenkonia natronophila]
MGHSTRTDEELPVIVIGAGPVGLAAAAHLLEHGIEPLVLEAGDQPGSAVAAWGHIKLFSPWRYNIDAACRRLLDAAGWSAPSPTKLPTGHQLVEEYLQPLVRNTVLAQKIQFGALVTGISRGGRDKTHAAARRGAPYQVRVDTRGASADLHARVVIDASGTWLQPNPMGAAGLPALGEKDPSVEQHLLGALPDVLGTARPRVGGKRVLVVGAGHSATNTLLNLAALKREEKHTEILWAIRGESADRSFGGGVSDGLPERGALGQRLRRLVEAGHIQVMTSASVQRLCAAEPDGVTVQFTDGRAVTVSEVAAATGFRPDLEVLRELRLDLDPGVESPTQLAPLIDPEFHSCGTVPAHGVEVLTHPEDDFFVAGMKSYGRAPTFLLATGYEQVRSIAAHLAGSDPTPIDLHLPETGVCNAGDPDHAEDPHALAVATSDAPGAEPAMIGVSTGLQHGRSGQ